MIEFKSGDKSIKHNYFVEMHPVPNECDPMKNPPYIIFDKTAELNEYTFRIANELSEIPFLKRVFCYKRTVEKIKESNNK